MGNRRRFRNWVYFSSTHYYQYLPFSLKSVLQSVCNLTQVQIKLLSSLDKAVIGNFWILMDPAVWGPFSPLQRVSIIFRKMISSRSNPKLSRWYKPQTNQHNSYQQTSFPGEFLWFIWKRLRAPVPQKRFLCIIKDSCAPVKVSLNQWMFHCTSECSTAPVKVPMHQ